MVELLVLIFDMDGVLVRTTFFSDILVEMLYHRFQEENLCIKKSDIFKEILKRFRNKLGDENKGYYAYDFDLIIREYLGEYNLHRSWTREIEDFFNSDKIIQCTSLYRDAEILEWLLQKNYDMAILTNGLPKYQDSVIKRLGLKRFFKKIIMPNPEIIKFIKPYPKIFKLTTIGFQGTHIMIGDSLYFDIYGAKQVGYKTIWIHRRLPKKYKKLSIQARTKKINKNTKFLLKYILRSAPFLKLSPNQDDLDDFKPNHIISNLQELKEIF